MKRNPSGNLTRREFGALSGLVLLGSAAGCVKRLPEPDSGTALPMFERFPALGANLPHISLGRFPTPVDKLEKLGQKIGLDSLYIKRDDVSGEIYGGNKIRKLEFLLAKALRAGEKEVITFGGAGSNHALATAIYAHKLGMRSISMLIPQPNAHYVRRNLLMSYRQNAELHHFGGIPSTAMGSLYQEAAHTAKRADAPQIIPVGGSSPLGTSGYVNAAFELRSQVEKGESPEPDLIYVAMGSMGTSAGLALGVRAAGLKTAVIPVRVTEKFQTNERKFVHLFKRTNAFLKSKAPDFPVYDLEPSETNVRHDFFGEEYALFTPEGMEAVKLMGETEGIKIEGTYTGKTLAALIHDAREGNLKGKTVMFWDTYNSIDFSDAIAGLDYHMLPRKFHVYFEQDVQPLDR